MWTGSVRSLPRPHGRGYGARYNLSRELSFAAMSEVVADLMTGKRKRAQRAQLWMSFFGEELRRGI